MSVLQVNIKTMQEDLIDSYKRIGHFRNWRLKVARTVVYAGLLTMFVLILSTIFVEHITSKVEAQNALKNSIYHGIYNR